MKTMQIWGILCVKDCHGADADLFNAITRAAAIAQAKRIKSVIGDTPIILLTAGGHLGQRISSDTLAEGLGSTPIFSAYLANSPLGENGIRHQINDILVEGSPCVIMAENLADAIILVETVLKIFSVDENPRERYELFALARDGWRIDPATAEIDGVIPSP